mmetsp:Transcript_3813/g.5712  ORF Transcript_3813/g.5712 Transcript_3813/m.5712 type:complete len:155 (-) Transcript_3813:236-700(-)|eukprot:CAMPEP_0196139358 /NCGR_PEP_ID=MMETSP0910-20130528/6662_1 /TAXON_ID=49265 /ORGANISM="Thalassiosira rotula, Strain GSO102" /LENGTH=154 /DNA_ID=CAMNT_0041400071 /DNA_START=261 /DNA_END=725 /DNA_ORIENTATION=+
MKTLQIVIFAISIVLFILVHHSQAWSYTPTSSRQLSGHAITSNTEPASSSSAISYQNRNYILEPSSSSSSSHMNSNNDLDAEIRLRAALQAARDADARYGLCTPASTHAWQIVDDIYSASPRSRQVEDNVKKALGREESIWSLFERGFERVYAM